MKSIYYSLLIAAISFTSCKKDPVPPAPALDFSVDGSTAPSNTIIATNRYNMEVFSEGNLLYTWDFGNGTTSTKRDTALSFDKSGNYTVSLTAKNWTGQSTTVKKQIKVVSPILNTITIQSVNWHNGDGSVPKSGKADIWIEFTKAEKGKSYPILGNGGLDLPVIYKTKVYQNATPDNSPILLNLPEKLILDQNAIYEGRLGISLYAKDAAGTYLLYSSMTFSGSNSVFNGNPIKNQFLWHCGFFGYQLDMTGTYE